MRIILQFPEGLKRKALDLAKGYERDGHEVFLSASPCYGACDLALDEARWIGAGKIVHFGHNRFIKGDLPVDVEYVDYRIDIDIAALGGLLPHLEGMKKVALATTVQHIHQLDEMRAFLEKNGKIVLIGKGERAQMPGQVLGCDAGAIRSVAKDADAAVFVGGGNFHALALDAGLPVFAFNPSDGKISDMRAHIERMRKRRKGAIAAAYSCKRFGILISTKPGQFNIAFAKHAKSELGKRGLEAHMLVANELEPLSLKNFMSFECFINTACPRMAEDNEEFGRPILDMAMLNELLAMLDSVQPGRNGP